ncbi:MAG: M24 family metallopeptidase [Alphaproteobacteria bacterium]|nr:M24 family metallopeptidase [Alphaproteobacteria bacterium]
MVPLPFERSEYDRRLGRVRVRMAERGLELLIVTDIANQHFLTAYDGWSFYTPQVVVVPIEDEAPIWVGRAMDAAGGRLTAWMPPDHIVGWPEDHIHQSDRHPMDWVAAWIAGKGWGRRRIGIETDSYYYAPKAHARLVAGLPDARFIEADLLVNWVRAVKSPAEVEYLRKAARIAEDAMRVAYDVVVPGLRECDATARILAAQVAGQKDYAGDMTALPPTIMAGENAATPHPLWTDRRFAGDDVVALELAGACRHYTAGLARTMQLGRPIPALKDLALAVGDGMDAALGAVRPGATGGEVEAAWRAVLSRHGLKKESRIGYSIGLGYPPDWGEHTISLRAGDRSVLEPGNVLHIILGMWMDGWGYELSETVLVTAQGAQCLTDFPRDLFVKA